MSQGADSPEITRNLGKQILAERRALVLGRAIDEVCRPLLKIRGDEEAAIDDSEAEMVLDHALDRPSLSALVTIEALIEIDAILALDMRTDEGGIGDELAVLLDERNLALRRPHRPARVLFVRDLGRASGRERVCQ